MSYSLMLAHRFICEMVRQMIVVDNLCSFYSVLIEKDL